MKRVCILVTLLVACAKTPPPKPRTCAEKSLDDYIHCMGMIGTQDSGCKAVVDHVFDECVKRTEGL